MAEKESLMTRFKSQFSNAQTSVDNRWAALKEKSEDWSTTGLVVRAGIAILALVLLIIFVMMVINQLTGGSNALEEVEEPVTEEEVEDVPEAPPEPDMVALPEAMFTESGQVVYPDFSGQTDDGASSTGNAGPVDPNTPGTGSIFNQEGYENPYVTEEEDYPLETRDASQLMTDFGRNVALERVISGDTILVREALGDTYPVRIQLIDAPERGTYKGEEAAYALGEYLSRASRIEIKYDAGTVLEDGHHLAYVYADREDIGHLMVTEGYARMGYVYDQDAAQVQALEEAEAYAQSIGYGVWEIPGYVNETGEGFDESVMEAYYGGQR